MLDLVGINAKIDRARIALQSLESDISAVCDNRRRQIIFNLSNNPSLFVVDPPSLPIDYSIRAGEITYNLRSGLDHLVWQLVKANGGVPCRNHSFPICDKDQEFRRSMKRALKGVAEGHCELIESFQPFQKDGDIGSHLWMLNCICNIDKHRHLNVVALHEFTNLSEQPYIAKVDACFMDESLETKSPGYGSSLEFEGIKRPPVVSVLYACLFAVSSVVSRLSEPVYVFANKGG